MNIFNKFLLLLGVAFVLLSCEEKRPDDVSETSRLVKETASFIRDTSAYVMVVDTSVHDSVFGDSAIPVEQGGFTEYFADLAQRGSIGKKTVLCVLGFYNTIC